MAANTDKACRNQPKVPAKACTLALDHSWREQAAGRQLLSIQQGHQQTHTAFKNEPISHPNLGNPHEPISSRTNANNLTQPPSGGRRGLLDDNNVIDLQVLQSSPPPWTLLPGAHANVREERWFLVLRQWDVQQEAAQSKNGPESGPHSSRNQLTRELEGASSCTL